MTVCGEDVRRGSLCGQFRSDSSLNVHDNFNREPCFCYVCKCVTIPYMRQLFDVWTTGVFCVFSFFENFCRKAGHDFFLNLLMTTERGIGVRGHCLMLRGFVAVNLHFFNIVAGRIVIHCHQLTSCKHFLFWMLNYFPSCSLLIFLILFYFQETSCLLQLQRLKNHKFYFIHLEGNFMYWTVLFLIVWLQLAKMKLL